ncbi:unnamed protein product [Brachionus calyciflorus]|uniref:Uncharacterized protein n=1 Tax=Brachionus calyciflorus TaxID=104777 RepID=A0A813PUH2_9BILA|nr:unnamed protein product [Brachionus calyciflorus]
MKSNGNKNLSSKNNPQNSEFSTSQKKSEKLKVPSNSILNNYPSVSIKRDNLNTASTQLSHYLPNITYSITPNLEEDISHTTLNPKKNISKTHKEIIHTIKTPVSFRATSFIEPQKIIFVSRPFVFSTLPEEMQRVKIIETPRPTVIKRITPQIIQSQGPKTISLIRNTPGIMIANPSRIMVQTPVVQVPVIQNTIPVSNSIVSSSFIPHATPALVPTSIPTPLIGQNTLGSNSNLSFKNSIPSGISQNSALINSNIDGQGLYKNPVYGQPPFKNVIPIQNGVIPNGIKNGVICNANGRPIGVIENGIVRYYNSEKNENDKKLSDDKREQSPIILFHDRDDLDKENGELHEDSLNSRQGTKSKAGRNKLDFISNLFDGYYYTNIDYREGENVTENEKDKPVEIKDEKFQKNVGILNKPNQNDSIFNNQNTNSSYSRFSQNSKNSLSNSLPKINQSVEKKLQPSRPLSSKRSNQNSFGNRELIKKSSAAAEKDSDKKIKSEKGQKLKEAEPRRLNYPRNSVFAK